MSSQSQRNQKLTCHGWWCLLSQRCFCGLVEAAEVSQRSTTWRRIQHRCCKLAVAFAVSQRENQFLSAIAMARVKARHNAARPPSSCRKKGCCAASLRLRRSLLGNRSKWENRSRQRRLLLEVGPSHRNILQRVKDRQPPQIRSKPVICRLLARNHHREKAKEGRTDAPLPWASPLRQASLGKLLRMPTQLSRKHQRSWTKMGSKANSGRLQSSFSTNRPIVAVCSHHRRQRRLSHQCHPSKRSKLWSHGFS
mmetsp:Transcript_45682/g.72989  ORF Transcript_45682/g.72989 Transcript_45682/m.72989 type:complete len:252 (+) Transcript_45682:1136-1891(+)